MRRGPAPAVTAALAVVLLSGYAHAERPAFVNSHPWDRLPDTLAGIRAPTFRDCDFPFPDFGGEPSNQEATR